MEYPPKIQKKYNVLNILNGTSHIILVLGMALTISSSFTKYIILDKQYFKYNEEYNQHISEQRKCNEALTISQISKDTKKDIEQIILKEISKSDSIYSQMKEIATSPNKDMNLYLCSLGIGVSLMMLGWYGHFKTKHLWSEIRREYYKNNPQHEN